MAADIRIPIFSGFNASLTLCDIVAGGLKLQSKEEDTQLVTVAKIVGRIVVNALVMMASSGVLFVASLYTNLFGIVYHGVQWAAHPEHRAQHLEPIVKHTVSITFDLATRIVAIPLLAIAYGVQPESLIRNAYTQITTRVGELAAAV